MALQVWLPLTQDTRNQGLCGGNITTSGITFTDGGKLGAKYLSAGTITIPASTCKKFFNKNHMSFAFWLYPIGTSSSAIIMGQNAMSAGNNRMYSIFQYSTPNDLHLSWQDETSSTTFLGSVDTGFFTADTWTHCCITYNGSIATVYRNGVLYSTHNGTSNRAAFEYDYPITGSTLRKLQDVRIYDHCLSSTEVKELAKGLILHYPLSNNGGGNENLFKGMYHTTTTYSGGNSPSGTLTLDSTVNLQDLVGKTLTFSFEYSVQGAKYNTTGNWQNDRYGIHLSCNYTPSGGSATTIYPAASYLEMSGTGKAIQTFTLPSNCTINSFGAAIQAYNKPASGNNATWYIRNCKLEFGDKATTWCPAHDDPGYIGNIEYDCSGYGNNGTRIGTFSWTSDMPKYAASTHIGTTSSKIHISNFPTSGFGNSYSFAWWGKRSSNSPMFWGFSDGIRLNGMYIGTLWNTGDSSNNPLYNIGTTTQVTAPSVNTWHHYVMTGNGTKCYVYLDGQLWAEAKTYKAISGTSIYINGWDSGTQYCSDNTDISDFRIYATALSASDVLSLYQNNAYIDSNNTIHGKIRT